MPSIRTIALALSFSATTAYSDDLSIEVGEPSVIANRTHCNELGLDWFVDGNIGIVASEAGLVAYAANGASPVRFPVSPDQFIENFSAVEIKTSRNDVKYMAGGPVYSDPDSGSLLLFYHAEIHRGSVENFYSTLGLAIATDETGLVFEDVGEFFVPHTSNADAESTIEVCGSPYVVHQGYFYVYARDKMGEAEHNLVVVRAPVADVVAAARKGKSAEWKKYFEGAFSQPGIGGKSSPLEKDNPSTRWMDLTFNTELDRILMVVAENDEDGVGLYLTHSADGLEWSPRQPISSLEGESFYPSIIDYDKSTRETGGSFSIVYTHSKEGEWNRWKDANIMRQEIIVNPSPSKAEQAGADQPATVLESKPEGKKKTKRESEGRSQ